MSIDMNRVGLLLHVITEAIQHGAAYRDIAAEANFELLAMNDIAREDGLKRAKAKAEAEAKRRAEEQARVDELAKVEEDKLRAEAQAKLDDEIKTKAQVAAAAQAKAEAEAKTEVDAIYTPKVDPAMPPSDSTFTSDNGRRL